jgi:NADPH-dependent F420 reductase
MKIAIFGGTGDLGRGLAICFAAAGHQIIVGSRSQERADQAADGLRTALPSGTFVPMENVAAANAAELAVVSIPWEGIEQTIPPMADALAGKVVITVANALKFGKSGAIAVQGADLPGGAASCAHAIQDLAPEAKVVVAYNNLPAAALQARHHLGADVLVCGKSREAREAVIELTKDLPGARGLDAGPLANALIIEGMTALVINMNKRYGGEASLQITGLETAPEVSAAVH